MKFNRGGHAPNRVSLAQAEPLMHQLYAEKVVNENLGIRYDPSGFLEIVFILSAASFRNKGASINEKLFVFFSFSHFPFPFSLTRT